MLVRKPRLLRFVASWLLVQTLTQIAWPMIGYALTAGPTAPEATSFEPVDTTDMVNLASGDLTYNIPLLEVPGPEGGYPISLAYHAGVEPDVEASWVGLGWSLNPGAINRNVNGYADDQQNDPQVVHDYWAGGTRTTYTVGVGVGLGQGASVSAGLSFSNDTYRGFAVGEYIGGAVGWGNGAGSLGLSARLSDDGYGNAGAGVSVGASTKGAVGVGANVGLSTNFSTISANAGAGVSVRTGSASNSLIGASISSNGGGFSVRGPGGSAGINNSTAGRIQTQSNGQTFDIPIPGTPAFVELGYDYTRYWSDETDVASVNGALYFPKTYTNAASTLDNQAYDTYRVADPQNENVIDNPDPDWLQGGSFPNYDNYNVVAQGLAGSMRPFSYQRALYSRNRKAVDGNNNSYYAIKDNPLSWTNKALGFRFEGDFSNSYLQENGLVSSAAYTFSTPTYGNADGDYGYDAANDRLAGSKHIDYYTNSQIVDPNGHSGFVDTDAKGFDRQAVINAHPEVAAQIGGFSITNTSGVTYHFALPAYAYDEYTRTQTIADPTNYNELTKRSYYAYTWFLTAITGPDYVDRNANGVDASDWGYWAKFNYGKWSDHYGWRNPALGARADVDAKIKTYSRGRKEVYYLNSVATRTHTALFEKEIRFDSKSATATGFSIGDETVTERNLFVRTYSSDGKPSGLVTGPGSLISTYNPVLTTQIHEEPSSTLRLKSIILVNNKDINNNIIPPNLESYSSTYNKAGQETFTVNSYNSRNNRTYYNRSLTLTSQLGQNVIDVNDIDPLRDVLYNKSIRIIKFDHDYSLTPNTPNSINDSGINTGKLTLKSIAFVGVQGISSLPPTRFGYEVDPASKQGNITLVMDNSGHFATNNVGLIQSSQGSNSYLAGIYEAGDILVFQQDGINKYLTVLDQVSGTSPAQYRVRYLSDVSASNTAVVAARATKNPPYLSEYRDWWGMFKSDYNPDLTGLAEGIARRTSSVSNKATDAWSLRTISSPLGSNINISYEGDQYSAPVLSRPDMVCKISVLDADPANHPNQQRILLKGLTLSQAQSVFSVNQKILENGLSPYSKSVNGSYITAYKTLQNIEVFIQSIEKAPSFYGDAAVLWVSSNTYTVNLWNQGLYISLPKTNQVNEGGGLRVKSVGTLSNGITHVTKYFYNTLYSNKSNKFYLPSGVTSYEPGNILRFDKTDFTGVYGSQGWPTTDEVLQYKKDYTNSLMDLFAVAREVPAPGVMYGAVTINESVTRADGTQISAPNSWTYRFEVFKSNMIGHVVTRGQNSANRLYTSNVSVKDYTSRIGSLLSSTHYGSDGRKISSTVNHFLHDDLDNASYAANSDAGPTGYQAKTARYNYQGITQESFGDSRDCYASDNNYDHKVVMTKRDVYPTIQTSTTTTDYLTGLSTTSESVSFDFYSGMATKTASTDGYGNRFVTEVIPAYRRYPVMGLKVKGATNRNMLSQVAVTTNYKADANNAPTGVVSASVQTWSDQVPVIGLTDNDPEKTGTQSGIWRPWQTYSWMPTGTTVDGLTPMTGANGFTAFTDASPAPTWRKTSETTLYNAYSNALEAKDIQNVYLATKLGVNQSKVFLSGGPAKYNEIAYTGAEEPLLVNGAFSGRVAPCWPSTTTNFWTSRNQTPPSVYTESTPTGKTHTGQSSILVHNNQNGVVYQPDMANLDGTKPYRASVWATTPNLGLYYCVDENTAAAVTVTGRTDRSANGWYLITLDIPSIGTGHSSLRVGTYNGSGQDIYVDDFRFQPVNAQVNAYVYDPLTGQVAYILDNNNLYTHYEYDSAGKLKRVSRETLQYGVQKVVEHSYHLAGILDAASLETSTFNATVNVSELAEPIQLQYDIDDGNGYRSLATANGRPYTFLLPSPQLNKWLKVRIKDNQGNVRELVKHLP